MKINNAQVRDAAPVEAAAPDAPAADAAPVPEAAPATRTATTGGPSADVHASMLAAHLESKTGAAAATFVPHVAITKTQDGQRGEPINIYVHGSLEDIKASMKAAGFTEALPNTAGSKLKYVGEAVVDVVSQGLSAARATAGKWWDRLTGHAKKTFDDPKPLPGGPKPVDNMPISVATLDGKPQVAAFSSQNDPLGGRHHFRVFDTGQRDAAGKPVFAIQASRDIGIVFDKNRPGQLFMNHSVEKNTDIERDFVVKQLEKAGVVQSSTMVGGMDDGEAGYYKDSGEDKRLADVVLRSRS